MVAKYSLTLNKEFTQYCELNDIEDVEAEAKRIFEMGFAVAKFGTKPGETKRNLPEYKNPPPPPPAPPSRKIVEGKKPESPEEYSKRNKKIQDDHKKLYDE